MKKLRNLSIKTIFTLIFVAIFATLFAVLFFINKFMLQDYYKSQKMKQIGIAYSTIDKAVLVAEDNGETIFDLINNEAEMTTDESPTIAIFRTLNERSNIDVVLMNSARTMAAGTSRDANWLAMKLNVYMNYLGLTDMLSNAVQDELPISDRLSNAALESEAGKSGSDQSRNEAGQSSPDQSQGGSGQETGVLSPDFLAPGAVAGGSYADIGGGYVNHQAPGSESFGGTGGAVDAGSTESGGALSSGSAEKGSGSGADGGENAAGDEGGSDGAGSGRGAEGGVNTGSADSTVNGAGSVSSAFTDDTSLGTASGKHTDGRLFSADISEVNEQVKLLEQNENYFIQLVVDARSNTSHLECMGVFSDNDTYFLMTTPIESIEEGVGITTKFMFITGMIMLVVGSFVVYYAVGKCTAPINRLARLSDKIANLDFSERYKGDSENELGLLGNSMNVMSDKLEASIRELSAANEKLQADIEEKIKMDDARKEFIADVSHELKTPIALIEGYAEGLVEGLAEDKSTRDYYCNVIIDEAVKMNKMVKQLTSLISYEFGSNVPELQEFDMCYLIRSVTDSMKLRFEEKEAVLTLDMPESAAVCADEFKIEEVFTNYLNNAFNHLNGARNIIIKLYEDEDSTTVSVYNDGIPIPEESLDRVWDKFYKVDKARTRSYGGSGIGLSIVKAIMESHGGKYGVMNHEHGVEFYFTLRKDAKAGE